MSDKYPIWYSRLLYSYAVSEEDAEWMFDIWEKCDGTWSIIREIADRCKWISNDKEGMFEIYSCYVPEHFVVDKYTVGYKKVLVPANFGRADCVNYLDFLRDNAEYSFMHIVDRLGLIREKSLFLLWKRCMEDGPGRELRVLMSFSE